MTERGILTMCYEADWRKAVGLALSLKARSCSLPTAVVAPAELEHKLSKYFDYFIPEKSDLSGFMHKLFLDEYSPFTKTLFIDADILALRDPIEIFEKWAGMQYMTRGRTTESGMSHFGLDRASVLRRTDKPQFVVLDSAGHAYFEKPACIPVFERAREIASNYDQWAPDAKIADEDVMGIVMTDMDITPVSDKNIVGYPVAVKQTIKKLDARLGQWEYIDWDGDTLSPLFIHFFNNMSPLCHYWQIFRLAKPHSIQFAPWLAKGFRDFAHYQAWWGLKKSIKKTISN